jgi:MFS transporter, AAHS family, 4-hydroxybenzoate transporter
VITLTLLLVASFAGIPHRGFQVLNAFIGFFLIGGHFGVLSVCGVFYPSAFRGNGTGWASSMSKIGSVAGPLVGGYVLSTHLPVRYVFAVLAICPAIFASCIFAVGRIHSRILGREALAELGPASLALGNQPLPQVQR